MVMIREAEVQNTQRERTDGSIKVSICGPPGWEGKLGKQSNEWIRKVDQNKKVKNEVNVNELEEKKNVSIIWPRFLGNSNVR